MKRWTAWIISYCFITKTHLCKPLPCLVKMLQARLARTIMKVIPEDVFSILKWDFKMVRFHSEQIKHRATSVNGYLFVGCILSDMVTMCALTVYFLSMTGNWQRHRTKSKCIGTTWIVQFHSPGLIFLCSGSQISGQRPVCCHYFGWVVSNCCWARGRLIQTALQNFSPCSRPWEGHIKSIGWEFKLKGSCSFLG